MFRHGAHPWLPTVLWSKFWHPRYGAGQSPLVRRASLHASAMRPCLLDSSADRRARRRVRQGVLGSPGAGPSTAPLGTAPVRHAGVRPLAALAARGRTPPAAGRGGANPNTISHALCRACEQTARSSAGAAALAWLTSPMALRVLVLLLAHCAARPAPPRSLTLYGGAKKKAIKHGPRQRIRRRRRVTH